MPRKGEQLHTVLADYTVEGSLGSGGAGDVYRVKDDDGNQFAAKVLDASASSTKRKRFLREIEYCKRSANPSLIDVTDYGVYDSGGKRRPFYVMPLYDGSLRQSMKEG